LEKNNEDDNVEIVEDLKREIKVNIRVYYCRQGENLQKQSAKTICKKIKICRNPQKSVRKT